MELKMQIDGRVLDTIKVHLPSCNDESYLAWLKKELCRKHEERLCLEKAEPLFFLEASPFQQEKHAKTA